MAIETLTPTTVTGIANPTGVFSMLVKVEVESVRITWEGTEPSTTVGILMEDGDSIMVEGETRVKRFRCIQAAPANGAKVIVMY
jgi:hypothetical protein